jgi:hypothetical protein
LHGTQRFLPCLQETSARLHLEPDESRPYLFSFYFFTARFNIISSTCKCSK